MFKKLATSVIALSFLALAACAPSFKASDLIPASVEIDNFCSGSVISETHILTAAHCMGYGTRKSVRVHVGDSWFTAYLVKADKDKDLALLVVPGVHFKGALKIADEQGEIGDKVIVIGYPQGAIPDVITFGFISKLNDSTWFTKYWKTLNIFNVAGSPGNSGSAMVNERGEVIGVLVSGIPYGEGGSAVTLGVTLKDIKDFLASIK